MGKQMLIGALEQPGADGRVDRYGGTDDALGEVVCEHPQACARGVSELSVRRAHRDSKRWFSLNFTRFSGHGG